MEKFLGIYYIGINLIGFFFMGMDKHFAQKHRSRIPERHLFTIAYLGGGLGSLIGMTVFHHKTRKMKFKILIPLALLVHVLLLLYIFVF